MEFRISTDSSPLICRELKRLDITRYPLKMKPTVQEEIEDDLAAEEENKLINEVSLRDSLTAARIPSCPPTFQEYKTW